MDARLTALGLVARLTRTERQDIQRPRRVPVPLAPSEQHVQRLCGERILFTRRPRADATRTARKVRWAGTVVLREREADRSSAQLQDHNGEVIAFYRPTRPQRYNIGEVHGELHFVRNAGAGVVVRRVPFPSPSFFRRNAARGSLIDRWAPDHAPRTDASPAHGHRNGYSDVVPVRDGVRTVNLPRGCPRHRSLPAPTSGVLTSSHLP